MNEQIKIIRAKDKKDFLQKWAKLEDKAYHTNFCGEPYNWACFCNYVSKGKHYSASPKFESLTIEISELDWRAFLGGL